MIDFHLERHVITINGVDYDSRTITIEEARKLAEATHEAV